MVIHITGGNAENDGNQIVIFVGKCDVVDVQKYEHGVSSDAFVAVHERVIVNESITQTGSFFENCGVELTAESSRPSSRSPSMPPDCAISMECNIRI